MKKYIVFLFIYSCTTFNENGNKQLKQDLTNVFQNTAKQTYNGDSVIFKLDTITKFKWDKVYFFHKYENTDVFDERLKKKWIPRNYQLGEYDNFLVFMLDDNIVNHVSFRSNQNDSIVFRNLLDLGKFYTPENAIFKYVRKPDNKVVGGYDQYLTLPNL